MAKNPSSVAKARPLNRIDGTAERVAEILKARTHYSAQPKPLKFRHHDNVVAKITSEKFLAALFRREDEYRSRIGERQESLQLIGELIAKVKQVRYDQRTLKKNRAWAMNVLLRMWRWKANGVGRAFEKLVKQMGEAESDLYFFEKELVFCLPIGKHKPEYAGSGFIPFVPVDHSLAYTRDKFEEQRLWKRLDAELRKVLGESEFAIGRYGIISILCNALGLGWTHPSTIKQHFYQQKKRRKRKNRPHHR